MLHLEVSKSKVCIYFYPHYGPMLLPLKNLTNQKYKYLKYSKLNQ